MRLRRWPDGVRCGWRAVNDIADRPGARLVVITVQGQWTGLVAERPWSGVRATVVNRSAGEPIVLAARFAADDRNSFESNRLLAVARIITGEGASSGRRRRADFPRRGSGSRRAGLSADPTVRSTRLSVLRATGSVIREMSAGHDDVGDILTRQLPFVGRHSTATASRGP